MGLGVSKTATAEATQTPVDMAAMQGLTVCSAAIAGRIDCEVRPGYIEPVNLYTATMMAPGNRKSSVHASATAPLHEHEQRLIENARSDFAIAASERRVEERRLASLEKQAASDGDKSDDARASLRDVATWLEENPAPALPQIITDDATAEALAIAMQQQGGTISSFSPEGGCFDNMAGKYGEKPNFDIQLKAHGGDRFRQTRVSRIKIDIERPVLTCCYTLQPYHFEQLAATRDLRGRGLLARFLYSVPASFIGSRVSAAAVPAIIQEQYRNMVLQLCCLPDGTFTFSTEADECLLAWFDELEPRLGPDGDLQYIADWGGKLVGATARIAAILQAVKQGSDWVATTTVEADTVEAAIEVARYLIPHAERAFGLLTGHGHHETVAQELLRRIRLWADDSTLTRIKLRDLHQRVRRQYTVKELEGPLEELVERGWLHRVEQKDKRASPAFDIHPELRC